MSGFSDELRRLMTGRGIGVRELARQVPCNPGYLSNLRNGNKRPSRQIAARFDELLDAGGLLAALSAGSLADHAEDTGAPADAARLRLDALTAAQLDELTAHLGAQWHALVKTDNMLGPRHALDGVHAYLGVIGALLKPCGRLSGKRCCGWARDTPSRRHGCMKIPVTCRPRGSGRAGRWNGRWRAA